MPAWDLVVVRPASNRWRSVRWRWPPGEDWIVYAVVVYLTAVTWGLFPHLWLAGFLVSLPAAVLVLHLLRGLWAMVIAPRIVRYFPPAVDVPAPPSQPDDMMETFIRAPLINYPGLAFAQGQCGWVVLRLRIDAKGRIIAFKVGEQTPGRVFEEAVTSSLSTARLAPAHLGARPREADTVFVFPTEGKATPTWARARLEAVSPKDRPRAVRDTTTSPG